MRGTAVLVLGGAACLLLAAPGDPRLLWNTTSSVPIGLYGLSDPGPLAVGDLVVARAPPPTADLLARRGWLPPGVPLLKPVAAIASQTVCRDGAVITVDGRRAAKARPRDLAGRPLPEWSGCRRLAVDEVFLLSPASPNSFDGRYMGVTARSDILAKAKPLRLWGRGRL